MNWEQVSGEWQRLGPMLKSKWGKLTDGDLASGGDKRELLVKALEGHYGLHRKHAELQLDAWVKAIAATVQEDAAGAAPPAGKPS